MFVVRNIFSRHNNSRETFARFSKAAYLPADFSSGNDPLDFLFSEGGATSITDAAYLFARHEAGADVILFGTRNKDHVKDDINAILRPPLAPEFVERIQKTFGHLVGVGLDLKDHMMSNSKP